MPTEYDPETGKPIKPPPPTGKTPLEQMRQEHVIDLPTPAFSREVTLADVLVELQAIRVALESVIEPAIKDGREMRLFGLNLGVVPDTPAHVRIAGNVDASVSGIVTTR